MGDPEPDLRFLQANERTLLAWVRTGLAFMAFGFVIARLAVWLRVEHPERDGSAGSTWLGLAAVALGIACQLVGASRYARARRALVEGKPLVPGSAGPMIIAGTIAAVGVAVIVYLASSAP